MAYSKEALDKIDEKYRELNLMHNNPLLELMTFQQRLKNEKAKEYLMQGAGRRLSILYRCMNNIFTIFPAERIENLSKEELADVNINLHAFFINIAGVFDNLGWVFVYENELLGKTREGNIPRNGVGLFCVETKSHLAPELRDYLNSDLIESWYTDYSKNYRDSLAHRIPLYVPPSLLNKEEEKLFQNIDGKIQKLEFSKECDRDKYDELRGAQLNLGRASHIFTHSINEECLPVYFHAQVLSDLVTVRKVIEIFCRTFK